MSQTVVAEQAARVKGGKADSGFDDVISRLAEGEIQIGHLAILGTDLDRQAKLPGVAGDITDATKPLGVAVRSHAIESSKDSNPASVKDKDMVSLMRQGRINVLVEEDVVPTDPVFVRYAAGGDGPGGWLMSDPGSAAAELANAEWKTSALAGELAVLQLNGL